jgi:hypothetical protein
MADVTVDVGGDSVVVEVPTHVVDLTVAEVSVEVSVENVSLAVDVQTPNVLVTVPHQQVEVYTSSPVVDVDVVGVEGKPGPEGDPGPRGLPGPPGPGGLASQYIHQQTMLSPSWVVQHNLGKHPEITCEDGGGSVIVGSILYLDDNTALIGFAFSVTGRANCT